MVVVVVVFSRNCEGPEKQNSPRRVRGNTVERGRRKGRRKRSMRRRRRGRPG